MKATSKQKRIFEKTFEKEWRKMLLHIIARKTALAETLEEHDLKSVSLTETLFFEELARDAVLYYTKCYLDENMTESVNDMIAWNKIMGDVNNILNSKKKP